MTLIEKLRADQLAARKAKEAIKASLLTTLIGEASMIGKNDGNRETSDAEVTAVIKKFLKNNRETLDALGGIEGGVAMQYMAEARILQSYLPKQMTYQEIMSFLESLGLPKEPKSKGAMMKALKEQHAGKYDGKTAAAAVDELLKA